MFKKATRKQLKAKIGLVGPAGSGKTYTALKLARGLGEKIALLDTEHRTASKYAGDVADFDTAHLESFAPERYIEAMEDAAGAGYDVLIIDSLTHAWTGKDGILDSVDKQGKRERGGSFSAWRDQTPRHNALVEALLSVPVHLIVTMRVKMEYVQEKDPKTGKTTIRKVGLQPIQRDGLEYEFDIVGDMTVENQLVISKSRMSGLTGEVIRHPDEKLGQRIRAWLDDGEEAPKPREMSPLEITAFLEEARTASNLRTHFARVRDTVGNRDLMEAAYWMLVTSRNGKDLPKSVTNALMDEVLEACPDYLTDEETVPRENLFPDEKPQVRTEEVQR